VKRSIAGLCVLAALAAAVIQVRDDHRSGDPGREQPHGSSAPDRSEQDRQLDQSIERARQRQARVDGLTERLTPVGR
jgi:hypothetical protein